MAWSSTHRNQRRSLPALPPFSNIVKDFSTTLDEDEDHVSYLSTRLKGKIIPRSTETSSESGSNKDLESFRKNQMVVSRKTVQRRASEMLCPSVMDHYRLGVSPMRSPKPRGQRPMLGTTRRAAVNAKSKAGPDLEYYKVRSFSIVAQEVRNLGDSLRSRPSRSINSATSSGSAVSAKNRSYSFGSQMDQESQGPFIVAMLGASGVGKTSLASQFISSEYIRSYDTSLEEEYGQKNVTVSINNLETELEIMDHPASEMSVESFCATYNADMFVVVYSVDDKNTFKEAENILIYLWKCEYLATKGIILVANKVDLERKREVLINVGRQLANYYNCKFVEVSSEIAYNVDKLLLGISTQVNLNPRRETLRRKRKQRKGSVVRLLTAPKILTRLLGLKRKIKSCENLFII